MATFKMGASVGFWSGAAYDYSGEGNLAVLSADDTVRPPGASCKLTPSTTPLTTSITLALGSNVMTAVMFQDSNTPVPPLGGLFSQGFD